jgi:Acyl-CoA dehydrogenase, C-terminal domain
VTEAIRLPEYEEFRQGASDLLQRYPGNEALQFAGVAELVLAGGREMLPAGYAFIEMQGFHAASSVALSVLALADAALVDLAQVELARTVLTVPLSGTADAGRAVSLGAPSDCRVLIDLPGRGLAEIPQDVRTASGPETGDGYIETISFDAAACAVMISDRAYAGIRPQVVARARLAAAVEVLGACDRFICDAVEHARNREQFGVPIAAFQAIQHSLAWAATDRHQLTMLVDQAIGQAAAGSIDPILAETTKALAGVVSRRISQITLQVTGAMGFTWEYPHNQLNRRCMVLDQILGSADELHNRIGKSMRKTHAVPYLMWLHDGEDGAVVAP